MNGNVVGCYLGSAETVGVHRGHDEDVGGVEKLKDTLIGLLLGDQIRNHAQQNLTTDDFIAVDVTHQLHHGHKQITLTATHRVT